MPVTTILHNRFSNFHVQPNPVMLYFDQEKVLIPALSGETTPEIRAVSRVEGPFLGRLSDSAEGPLGRRFFGIFEQSLLLETLLSGVGPIGVGPAPFFV
jgi:hypothetical protein